MPELPEVETVRRGLEKAIVGQVIVRTETRRAGLRVPFTKGMEEWLAGKKILQVGRRAKYLLLELSGGKTLLLHLGMSGKILVKQKPPVQYDKHDHLVMHLNKGVVLFNDPRRFGIAVLIDTKTQNENAHLKSLGLEPLEKSFFGAALYALLKTKKLPIKTAIMDQKLVVGVGNIYASEALFESKISPKRMADKITKAEAVSLVRAIKKVLLAAIKSGGSTLRDYVRSDGDVGYFQHHFKVYGREEKPCLRCKGVIQKITQAGRSTFFCASCQR